MNVLIIGNLNGHIGTAGKVAIEGGGEVLLASDAEKGLDFLRKGSPDVVMIDVTLDIKTFIDKVKAERINTPIIACGIANDANAAVKAIRAGAKEYLPLPPDEELIMAVLKAFTKNEHTLIFGDEKTKNIIKMVEQIAPSEAGIFITGESGTGKEVFARLIHNKSKRSNNKFVAINCAAIPEALLESELFGHEKGAFTGAVARRIGKFEEANGGTLLLDEISEMDLRLQSKLLRVLQEKEIDRIGGKNPVSVNVRIIATSNRNMLEEIKKRTFREDLFFRLNIVNLNLPPLKERKNDILPLCDYFIKKYSKINGIKEKPLSSIAKNKLINYHWRGNVRELENTIHRAILITTGDEISAENIILLESPDNIENPNFIGQKIEDVERNLIIDTLKHTFGNCSEAAGILGISIKSLKNKIDLYKENGFNIPSSNSTLE